MKAGTTTSSSGQASYLSATFFLANLARIQHFSFKRPPIESSRRTDGWTCPMTTVSHAMTSSDGQTCPWKAPAPSTTVPWFAVMMHPSGMTSLSPPSWLPGVTTIAWKVLMTCSMMARTSLSSPRPACVILCFTSPRITSLSACDPSASIAEEILGSWLGTLKPDLLSAVSMPIWRSATQAHRLRPSMISAGMSGMGTRFTGCVRSARR